MPRMRAIFSYIRSRSTGDIALATFATAVGLWLLSRLVLASGVDNSLAGVVAATVSALVLMGAWASVIWIWFTRNRRL